MNIKEALKAEVFIRLKHRIPLFDRLPENGQIRISGIDCEVGVGEDKIHPVDVKSLPFPMLTLNGGQLIVDMDHPEYGTPECTNAVELTAHQEAMKVILRGVRNPPLALDHNNHDWQNVSYGCHESYSVKCEREVWRKLIPFFVARTLIAGSGCQRLDGIYELSQRASFMTSAWGEDTTNGRSYISARLQTHTTLKGWDRMHIVCGDSHMIDVNELMVYALTIMGLQLMEDNVLPSVEYDPNWAVEDGKAISLRTEPPWPMQGIKSGPKDALQLLRLYLDAARENIKHPDHATQVLYVLLDDTFRKLERNPDELIGRLDWVTKKFLIRMLLESSDKECRNIHPADVDLSYHSMSTDPDKSWFTYLRRHGYIERAISKDVLKMATCNPPARTRAFVRAAVTRMMNYYYGRRWCPANTKGECWTELNLRHTPTQNTLQYDIGDQFCTYAEDIPELEQMVKDLATW